MEKREETQARRRRRMGKQGKSYLLSL